MDKESYFKIPEFLIQKYKASLSVGVIQAAAMNYYFTEDWKKHVESPAIKHLDYDDLRKIVYIMEVMYTYEEYYNRVINYYYKLKEKI